MRRSLEANASEASRHASPASATSRSAGSQTNSRNSTAADRDGDRRVAHGLGGAERDIRDGPGLAGVDQVGDGGGRRRAPLADR